MVEEARLVQNESGLAPATEGWFVVNVRDAVWDTHDVFGSSCMFESPEAEFTGARHPARGARARRSRTASTTARRRRKTSSCSSVSARSSSRARSGALQAWDFVHCPPDTDHIFVGTGDGPVRDPHDGYAPAGPPDPLSRIASLHCATAPASTTETPSPPDAYASYGDERFERPACGTCCPGRRGEACLA